MIQEYVYRCYPNIIIQNPDCFFEIPFFYFFYDGESNSSDTVTKNIIRIGP
jgi:hypothetical protein